MVPRHQSKFLIWVHTWRKSQKDPQNPQMKHHLICSMLLLPNKHSLSTRPYFTFLPWWVKVVISLPLSVCSHSSFLLRKLSDYVWPFITSSLPPVCGAKRFHSPLVKYRNKNGFVVPTIKAARIIAAAENGNKWLPKM